MVEQQQELPLAYQLLGVRPGDTEAQLNKRFRRALFECHPDRPDGDPKKAATLNRIHDSFKRNLVNGRIPGPMEMAQRMGAVRQAPRPQPVVRFVHFGPMGGWSTSTTSTASTVSYIHINTGTGY